MSNGEDPSGWRPAPQPGGPPPPPPPPGPPAWGDAPPAPPPPPPSNATHGQPAGGWAQPPAEGWGNQYGSYTTPQQTETSAIVALVLACAAWVACPFVTAVVALAMVPSARTKIRESNGRLTGEGLLTATKVIAWIHLGLIIIASIAFVAFVIFLGALSSTTGT